MTKVNDEIEHLNEVDKFILLLLGTKNAEPVRSAIHLQKEIYFLQNVFPKLEYELDYEPYLLGPHSDIVDDCVVEMQLSDLIKKEGGQINLTSNGKKIFNALKNNSDDSDIQKITNFKEFLNDLTKDELLAFTYFSYATPEDLKNESSEYKELLPKRVRLAIAMYEKDKISAQKAAQIAGKNLVDFLEELKT